MLLLCLLPLAVAAEAQLGSYGRVQAATDATGGEGVPANVVSFAPRLEKGPYVELDAVFREQSDAGATFFAVLTQAWAGDLFHYDGEWADAMALRNLYALVDGWTTAPISVWAGARMYRGDDVHLLDFWPMDDLNTTGAGAVWSPAGWRVAAHAGLNRLAQDEWQLQYYEVPVAGGVGAESILTLDRQRQLGSIKVDRLLEGEGNTIRLRGYAEAHRLPAGERYDDDLLIESLPADNGVLLGAQLSAWGWSNDSFVHLWYRYATGLAAYSLLAVPETGYAADGRLAAARQHRVAAAANHEGERASLLLGAYVQRMDDADSSRGADWDDRWEAAIAVRPALALNEHASLAGEVSLQQLAPDGLSPRTDTTLAPTIAKLALIPAIQPRPGSFARPQLRAQYVLSLLDDDARLHFDATDTRARANVQHFVGIGAEWWLDSATYGF